MSEPNSLWLCRLVDLLVRNRLIVLFLAVVVSLLAWPVAQRLDFDQSIESLYAEDDSHLKDYQESKTLFGGDEFVIVAYTDPNLLQKDDRLSKDSEQRLRNLAEQLKNVSGVNPGSVQDLAQVIEQAAKAESIPAPIPFFRIRGLVDRVLDQMEGILIGADRMTTAVVLRLIPEHEDSRQRDRNERTHTFDKIFDIAKAHDRNAVVVGEPVQIHYMFRYVKDDGQKLFWWSLSLLASVLLVLFRSLRWVVLPLLVVVATVLWTKAYLVISGSKLSMVSSMLNSLVTIIGIATVTHVTVHFRQHRQEKDRVESMRHTFVELSPAIFWTCATTAVGFAALLSSQITPLHSFGWMMALATLLVLVAAASILPGGILLGRLSIDPQSAPAEKQLMGFLGHLSEWVARRWVPVIITVLLVTALAVCGFFFLAVETDFSKNFRASSPIVKALNVVETRLGGAGTWEINFPAPKVPNDLTPEYLELVRELADQLRALVVTGDARLTKVVALTDGLDLLSRMPLKLRRKILEKIQPEFESSLYNSEAGRMRILLRARERQSSESKLRLISAVEEVANREFPGATATGLFVLLTFLIESLLRDQLVSFALAAVGIGGMMTLAFRSLWIGLISLVPNLFPIVLVIGTMGWIGQPINIATAMIASVSIGLTVDSSIHYISAYRRERWRGLDVSESLRRTHLAVGRALVFANLALIVGFSVLTQSHFIPLIHFGILVSVAMFGGLIGNLVLLPLLLQWIEEKRN